MDNNATNKADAKERIIKAVLDIISQKGNISITVREISKKANVNLASINYHFRTTQNLFNEVENFLTEKILHLNKILENSDLDPKQSILSWSKGMMDLIYDNPGILWIIGNKVMRKDRADIFMGKFTHIKKLPISNLIRDVTGIKDMQLLTLKAIQIISGIIGPLILYYGVGKDSDMNLNDEQVREDYSRSLIESILKN
jgi:TetR/AcrR family transcriptional regulator, regulator of cefoperazone and chloramphenicol sensitivity